MTLVSYQRLSYAPPPERELLSVGDAGRFVGWRSSGSVVGRFAGVVPDLADLAGKVSAVAGSPAPAAVELPSGGSVEAIDARGITARFDADAGTGGDWGTLLASLRDLLGQMTDQPQAAVAIVFDDPARVRLEQRGTDALPVELDAATVTVEAWLNGRQLRAGGAGPLGLGRVMAGPGWAHTVDLALAESTATTGALVVARASFVAEDDGVFIPVTLISPPLKVNG